MKLLQLDLDLIKIIQFWTFWTFIFKPPQPFTRLFLWLIYRAWGHGSLSLLDLLLKHIILNILTNSWWFSLKLSQQDLFLQDNQNKLTETETDTDSRRFFTQSSYIQLITGYETHDFGVNVEKNLIYRRSIELNFGALVHAVDMVPVVNSGFPRGGALIW